MNDLPPFKQWMRQRRLALDLTQEALAEQVGCAPQTIRSFELGKRRPSRDLVERLADVLHVPAEQRAEFVRAGRVPVGTARTANGTDEQDVQEAPADVATERRSSTVALPTGTVTLMLLDIEGSTRLLQALGERYAELLLAYHRIVRATIGEWGGQVVDTQGDSCFVVFARALDGVRAALAIQRGLATHDWPGGLAVRVRIGLHTGEPRAIDGRYVGLDVHRAARIAAAGHGGQVLLSGVTADLVAGQLPHGVSVTALGAHRLKDLEHPEPIVQLVAPELPADFPPLRTLGHGSDGPAAPPLPLIGTKLRIPPARPRAERVARPRLIARLEAGLAGPLTLIAAPAGFGKTTLLSGWVSQGTGFVATTARGSALPDDDQPSGTATHVAWLALDERDSDPLVFLRYVIAALQTIDRAVGTRVLAVLEAGQPPTIDPLLPLLVNDLVALPDPSILILDDYHVIEAPAVHQALGFLLEHLPPQLHVMIASRVDPPLQLARLRVRGQLVELRAQDLRFTPDEAASFLQETMGLPLTREDVAALDARTEGWIAGLQLAALSLRDRPHAQRTQFIDAFAGSNRFVVDYLMDEVLARQPPHLQRFLLQTAILERLCGPLCDAVVGAPDASRPTPEDGTAAAAHDKRAAQSLLEELERSNLFLVPLDEERRWYRYHHLFAQVLRQRLASGVRPDAVALLHGRASAWFEAQGLVVEAVQHALAAADWERGACLLEAHGRDLIVRGHIYLVLGWLNTLPEPLLRARPALLLFQALGLLFQSQVEAAELRAHAVEAAMAADVRDEQSRFILGYAILIPAAIARFRGDLTRCITLSHRALEILPPADGAARLDARLSIASALLLLGDASAANERQIAADVALARSLDAPTDRLYGMVTLARLRRLRGSLRQAAATYREAEHIVPEPEVLRVLPYGPTFFFGLGDLLREWNELDQAAQLLAKGRDLAAGMRLAEWDLIAGGYVALARLQQARGERDAAWATLDELDALLRKHTFTERLRTRCSAARAHLALLQGDLPSAVAWAETNTLGPEDDLSYPREPEYLALARVRIAQGRQKPAVPELHAALQALDRLLAAAETGARMDSAIEILILRSLALQALGDPEGALAALDRALALAGPEGYIRVFVDEGMPLAQLLSQGLGVGGWGLGQAGAPSSIRTYAEQLMALIAAEHGADPSGRGARGDDHSPQPRTATTLFERLTERELEVLHLLAAGRSNQAIARELFVAVGTVKRHVNSILGKLHAESRLEAVARARDLNLV